MFILTGINIQSDLVQVFDTDDGSNDVVRLSVVAHQVTCRKATVKGIGLINAAKSPDSVLLHQYGIYVSLTEANKAFEKHKFRQRQRGIM